MKRRSIIHGAGLGAVLAVGTAPAVHAQTRVRWRMASSLPKSLDTLYGACEKFSQTLLALSGGAFEVSVHAPGDLMPAFGVVDGLQNATIEMAMTAPAYFTGKDYCFAFGCVIPFGFTARQMDAWMHYGGGRVLMDEFFAQYNIKSLKACNTGTQMGGWYRKEIKSAQDFKGLKMRLGGGLFGDAMRKLGVVAQNMPAGEIYQALEKGTLDAAEFIGPYDDIKLGLHKVAPYYYYPGWWEGGAEFSFFINTAAWGKLPREYQTMIEAAAAVAANDCTAKYDANNPVALKQLVAEKTQLRAFSKDFMDAGYKAVMELMAEHDAKSPMFKKLHESMRNFQRDQILWNRYSEYRYNQYMTTVKL